VRAKNLVEVESVRKLRREKVFKFIEKKHREAVLWKV
jgi:hypothetical protein